MASKAVRLDFIAMERSLRATGCDVPIKIIPFDSSRFELPENSSWLEDHDESFKVVESSKAVVHCRKLVALTQTNTACVARNSSRLSFSFVHYGRYRFSAGIKLHLRPAPAVQPLASCQCHTGRSITRRRTARPPVDSRPFT